MARLSKAQVEALLVSYDASPIESLSAALRIALDAPMIEWSALLELTEFSAIRHQRLLRGDTAALDELAAELNEVREVAAHRPPSHLAAAGDSAPPSGIQPR